MTTGPDLSDVSERSWVLTLPGDGASLALRLLVGFSTLFNI